MRTISVQHMPNGFEIETPSFGYWVKAGFAFTLGAGIVTITAVVVWWSFALGILGVLSSRH